MSYYAFISYSRKDIDVANWLHNKLEWYPYPKHLVSQEYKPSDGRFIRPVFIDVKDLHSRERAFSGDIQEALNNSEYLILICSKNSAKSEYVDKEVRYYLSVHNNDLTKIVPLFIDEVVDENIPPVIAGTAIMSRHFSIFNTALGKGSEANQYSFFHIVSYMLHVDFPSIYNRYEHYRAKQRHRKTTIFTYTIVVLALALGALSLRYHAQRELIEFEKDVFPAAVVFGYEENFLSPVVNYLKTNDNGNGFRMYILMPKNRDDLTHKNRVIDLQYEFKQSLGVDSIYAQRLQTETGRGSNVFRLYKDGNPVPTVYIDFAYTTSSFIRVAEYKKEGHKAYRNMNEDDIILEYTQSFIRQTKEKLHGDSVYVSFYIDKQDMMHDIKAQMVFNH